MTARMATGAGKGRSARQNWGFTKWSHSHWAEPNNSKQMIIVLTAMNNHKQQTNSREKSCTVTQSGIKLEMAGNNAEQ